MNPGLLRSACMTSGVSFLSEGDAWGPFSLNDTVPEHFRSPG